MVNNSEVVRKFLLNESQEFQRLVKKHRELDQRLVNLSERFLLNDAERFEAATLKKKKLSLKDKMALLIYQYQVENRCEESGTGIASA